MKICVFCSANSNIEPVYFEKTRELGEWCAKTAIPSCLAVAIWVLWNVSPRQHIAMAA